MKNCQIHHWCLQWNLTPVRFKPTCSLIKTEGLCTSEFGPTRIWTPDLWINALDHTAINDCLPPCLSQLYYGIVLTNWADSILITMIITSLPEGIWWWYGTVDLEETYAWQWHISSNMDVSDSLYQKKINTTINMLLRMIIIWCSYMGTTGGWWLWGVEVVMMIVSVLV